MSNEMDIKTKLMKNWESNEQFLREIPLPMQTETYSVVPHDVFIDKLKEGIDRKGYSIENTFYKTNNNGLQLTGRYDIKTEDLAYGMSVSFSNSYNKSMKAQVAAGLVSWACLNGKIFGEITFSRKHTGGVVKELNENIISCVNHIEEEFEKGIRIMSQLKERDISTRLAAELSGRAFMEQNIINATQLNIIKDRLEYDENFKDMNAYCLYEHFTEAAKISHTSLQMKTLRSMSNFFVDEFGLNTPKEKLIYSLTDSYVDDLALTLSRN